MFGSFLKYFEREIVPISILNSMDKILTRSYDQRSQVPGPSGSKREGSEKGWEKGADIAREGEPITKALAAISAIPGVDAAQMYYIYF